ncbi:peptidoglycan editing factor PgeF [Alicyclobacillus fodiniaquatilis]|uniref:Purine nucleoside phosphorylase n=1 Tax=Alicyclobacillus fodiniaquatilis TaxID=1661150 RepID=A0ABW4JLJ5_9BACL
MLTNWHQEQDGGICVQPAFTRLGVHALFSFRHHPQQSDEDLDVAFHQRLAHEKTRENRQYVAQQLGMPLANFVFVQQVHGTEVLTVDAAACGNGMDASARRIAADALLTNEKCVALAILTADCVPVLFYDPVSQVIGAAHSGWRGTVGHISVKVLETMKRQYHTRMEDVFVSIGPSIRRCCYEVDDVVAKPMQAAFSRPVLFPRFKRPGKYLLSMQAAIREDIERQGVPPAQIEDSGVCTSCRVKHLFSHRREQGEAGRQMAVISMP